MPEGVKELTVEREPAPAKGFLFGHFDLSWELAAYLALIIVAAAARFWDLSSRAMHHDESLHALYSWYLYSGRGYQHDPMMHGPLEFTGTAFIYFLFGVSESTARTLDALAGTALVALPYFLRGYLGRTGAFVTATMLAFSPTLLYYSRLIRQDMPVAFFTLGLVVCLWGYIASKRSLYLYLGAALLALSFATKENTYILVAIFGSFLFIWSAREWRAKIKPVKAGAGKSGLSRFNLADLSAPAAFMLLLATFTLPLLSAFVGDAMRRVGVPLSLGALPPLRDGLIAGLVILLFFLVSAALGLRWDKRRWLLCALIFWGIYIVLYTTFFTNPGGLFSGIWNSLDYWLLQQGVKRGGQPFYYYLLMLPIYEFLPLAFGIVAWFYYAVKGDVFSRFLVYWATASLLAYSYAGEKMPWLTIHVALPTIILAGRFIGELWDRTDWRALKDRGAGYVVLLAPVLFFGLIVLARLWLGGPPTVWTNTVAGIALTVVVAIVASIIWEPVVRLGLKGSLQTLSLVAFAVLLAFGIRAGWQASYYHGDIPVEMLVYTQTSPEIPKVLKDIEELSRQTGTGKDIRITVDGESGFTWPWAWYLRDYKNVEFPNMKNVAEPPKGLVALVHANNNEQAKPYMGNYGPGRRIPHRWWFPEDYRGLTLERFSQDIFNGKNWGQWWDYFMYRKLVSSLGSEDVFVYFPRDSAQAQVSPEAPKPPAPPAVEVPRPAAVRSNLSFGGPGNELGRFSGPRGIALDKSGNIYVVDAMNHRIQKFDASGKPLAQLGKQGQGNGEFKEPWGVAVDAEGNVYVADTWNHRIQKFTPDLRFVAAWGEFADSGGSAQRVLGKFYGPRDIAFDSSGNFYVADSGNKRIQKFSPGGRALAGFGGAGAGEGQFMEPVGIAIDASGTIYVADTWNRRIQKFDKDFKFLKQFPVPGWESRNVLNKPYLAIDRAGNVLAADPENHRVTRFTSDGVPLPPFGKRGVDDSSMMLPIGIAVDAAGNILVAEGGNDRVQRFPPVQ
ncbi:MAG: TIGR03663 family protein [Chloroflexi bacterium]|nr:TIGR03663 family protein [Chloroflexota bacterium]